MDILMSETCWAHKKWACNTDTTPTQPHWNSNTHRTKNNTTNVVIQQNSGKLLMMAILMSETCWAHKKWNKIASYIKLVFYSSTVTMMHGPVNIRFKIYPIIQPKFAFSKEKIVHDCYDCMYTLWNPIMYVHTECTSLWLT